MEEKIVLQVPSLNKQLRILCINIDYGIKTEIGKNLECISQMGANLLIYRPDLIIHKKIMKLHWKNMGILTL